MQTHISHCNDKVGFSSIFFIFTFYKETYSKKKFFVQLVELIIHFKAIDYRGYAAGILITPFGG